MREEAQLFNEFKELEGGRERHRICKQSFRNAIRRGGGSVKRIRELLAVHGVTNLGSTSEMHRLM